MLESACFDKQYVWRLILQNDHGFQIELHIARRFQSHRCSLISVNTLIQEFAWGWESTRGTGLFIEQVNWRQSLNMRAR